MAYMVAADTGGTFTDLVAYDRVDGRMVYSKSLTTYENLVDGVMTCVEKANISLRSVDVIKFGTTLVINTFLQHTGAKTALVTTAGHRDVLEIGRGARRKVFDLRYTPNAPLVPRDLRLEVRERIGGDGTVIEPLDEQEIVEVARRLSTSGIESIAVSFLNSYLNSQHEDMAAAALRKHCPDLYITAGSELTREWMEYERTSTAAANAYVGPRLNDYLGKLDRQLRESGFKKAFYMMASNGGVISVKRAQRQPVMLVESGPVGGCIGAGIYARELGLSKVIAFDMGGTTAKCAIVEDGEFDVKSPYFVGGKERGFPIRAAVLDIVEVGAGGGSIAWLDPQNRLHVGPRSAGSDPGPVSYGRGGTEPTITDANLVLGRIGAHSFLGGEMPLDEPAAAQAIVRAVAAPLGFETSDGLDQAAQGIVSLGAAIMASAIKQITIERGHDPRDFALIAFGGGGPLHAAGLARELNISNVIIPRAPEVFSALGMLLADGRVDETRTFVRLLSPETIDEMDTVYREMEREMQIALNAELGEPSIVFERQADMRFVGQNQTVRAPLGTRRSLEEIRKAFEEAYLRRYGHADWKSPIEIVSLVSIAVARLDRPSLRQLYVPARTADGKPVGVRSVYFAERGKRLDTPVYRRDSLPVGFTLRGPAVIEEYGSTTVVGPDDRVSLGQLGEFKITFT